MDVSGKVVWITGSGRGIGKEIAVQLAEKGARIVVSARTDEEIDKVSSHINANGDSAVAINCDVNDPQQIKSLLDQTKDMWGPIDILINNAGIGIFKKIIDLTNEDWNALISNNLTSAFYCVKSVLPDMMERRSGLIVNIVSVAGRYAYPNSGGYCASKFGMLGFNNVLRMETRDYGIKVTAILPGATQTAIWGDADVDFDKMISPKDVAKVVVEVCEAGYSAHIEEIVIRPQGGDL